MISLTDKTGASVHLVAVPPRRHLCFLSRRWGAASHERAMPRRRSKLLIALGVLMCLLCTPVLLKRDAQVVDEDRLTVVLTAYETEGLRPDWLRRILRAYASDEYADVIHSILLVWNEPDHEPPEDLPDKVVVIRAASNSLNNRSVLLPSHCLDRPVS